MMTPTSATVGPNGIAVGHNITVFHNIDFVATFGWGVGEELTVEVIRNGVLIGTATGPAVDAAPDGGALEVNHGPLGAPVDGDCWVGHTPDIRPGDTVRVTGATEVDDVIVDDITFSGPAVEDPVDGDIVVRGVAKFINGTAIPIAQLDSAEFRDTSQFRGVPTEVVADPGVDGGFQMRYAAPYELDRNTNNLNEAQRKASLLNSGGHAIGFGHVVPLPDHAMLVDGIDDVPGPALGCEGSPSEQRAVTSVSPAAINAANAGAPLVVSGLTAQGEGVDVSLASTGGGGVTQAADVTGTTWTTTFSAADLATLGDGVITASGAYGAALTGVTKTLLKDVTPPGAPTMSPAGGTLVGSRSVTLASAGNEMRYTTNGTMPTAGSAVYTGPIGLNRSTTLRAIAIDPAGNTGPDSSGVFTRATASSAPRIGLASPGARGRPYTAIARWSAPSNTGGTPIRAYELTAERIALGRVVQRVFVTRAASARSTQLRLARGTWRFHVRAVNAAGRSAYSAWSNRTSSR